MTIIRILNQSAPARPEMILDQDDPWVYLSELSQQTVDHDYLIVPWQDWQADPESFSHIQHLAIQFPNDGDLEVLKNQLDQIQMLVLDFPAFTDGRSYSIASTLKQQYYYQGELRATGDILPDQIHFMWRCGFDSLEVKDDSLAEVIINKSPPFTAFYQTAIKGERPIYKQRELG